MTPEIKVLLVDDNRDALASLNKQLNFEDVSVVGEAGFGPVAYTWANQLQPNVVLVAVEEPVARALATVETLALGHRHWPVIVISSKGDRESLRKAMRAGAADYIARSASANDLHTTIATLIRRERERAVSTAHSTGAMRHTGTIISVFGVKGGIGKTTLSTNLAASIAMESKQSVALLDLDLQFGDVALVMEAPPENTISDVVDALEKLDADLVDGFLARHASGVRVLPAPLHIDASEKITGVQVQSILEMLVSAYDYVVLDTPNVLNETVLAALDVSTLVQLMTTPELSCIKRTKSCLDLMKHWHYSEDKVKLIVNKANGRADANAEDIGSVLDYPVFWKLPFDRTADSVTGAGGLFVQARPKAKISESIRDLSRKLLGVERKRGLLGSLKFRFASSTG